MLETLSANGKSIGEVREFGELKVQEFTIVADIFFVELSYKKMWNEKIAAAKYYKKFNLDLNPAFCQYNVICSIFFNRYKLLVVFG